MKEKILVIEAIYYKFVNWLKIVLKKFKILKIDNIII
jgi:hypothetical protein